MDTSTVAALAARHGYGAPLTSARGPRLRSVPRLFGALVFFVLLPFVGVYVSAGLGLTFPASLAPVLGPLIVGGLAAVWVDEAGPRVQLFEGGAVITRPGAAVQAWGWAEMAPYERQTRRLAITPGPRFHTVLTLHGPKGVQFEFIGAEADRLLDVLAWGELVRARGRLAVQPLRYGPVTITPWEFAVDQQTVPWTEVTGVGSTLGWLEVRDRPAGLDARLQGIRYRLGTPHQRTVRALIEELSRQSA